MRPITALTLAALVAVALVACGSGSGASSSGGDIGKTFTLTYSGYGNGQGKEDIAVTLLKVVSPASSSEQGFSPSSGSIWVAVEVQVKNLDSAPYTGTPNDSMTAIDAAGQSVAPEEDAPTTVGNQFPDQLALTKGESSTGVVTFQVPTGDTIKTVKFTPGGTDGDATDVGKWAVG